MKLTKTKTEITIETRQRVTLRGTNRRSVWCPRCGSNVRMILPEHAAMLSKTTLREIYKKLERDELHFVETREGDSFVCSGSFKIE